MKPVLRALKFHFLRSLANVQSCFGDCDSTQPVAFVVGCGRSGTTILGQLLSAHPEINYYFEPYHLWAAIDRQTDVLNLYHRKDTRLMLSGAEVSSQTRVRFNRLIRRSHSANLTIEKTPLNALRIGYIEKLAPTAKFVHIVRDGVDVANSIDRLARGNTYKIAGMPSLNQWWGVDDSKWRSLEKEGCKAGYYPEAVSDRLSHHAKGAYEWLVSLKEIDRQRQLLGSRFYELNYTEFVHQPASELTKLCHF